MFNKYPISLFRLSERRLSETGSAHADPPGPKPQGIFCMDDQNSKIVPTVIRRVDALIRWNDAMPVSLLSRL